MSLEVEIKYRPQWRKTCWWELTLKLLPSSPSEPHQTLKLTAKSHLLGSVLLWEFYQLFDLTVLGSVFIFCILAWKRMPFFFHSILCLGVETVFWGGVKSARDFPGGTSGTPANAGDARDVGRSLGQGDPLEKGVATHSRILAWRIPRMEEPGRLQPMGQKRVRHDWSDLARMQRV